MKVPLEWVWENDPQELPDDDHARCIAAPGERHLACGEQLFAMTTRPCAYLFAADGRRSGVSFSTLQMEYRGLDWERGLAQQSWGGDRFASGSHDGKAQQTAGLALLATVAGALAAGSAVRSRSSSYSPDECDDQRQPLRPPGWPPPGHASRLRHPALLPLMVGRGGQAASAAGARRGVVPNRDTAGVERVLAKLTDTVAETPVAP